jgi:hypothetical protein
LPAVPDWVAGIRIPARGSRTVTLPIALVFVPCEIAIWSDDIDYLWITWMPPRSMAGAPLTGYDVLSSTPGGGDEEAFQGRWWQTLESAIPQVVEAETKH